MYRRTLKPFKGNSELQIGQYISDQQGPVWDCVVIVTHHGIIYKIITDKTCGIAHNLSYQKMLHVYMSYFNKVIFLRRFLCVRLITYMFNVRCSLLNYKQLTAVYWNVLLPLPGFFDKLCFVEYHFPWIIFPLIDMSANCEFGEMLYSFNVLWANLPYFWNNLLDCFALE